MHPSQHSYARLWTECGLRSALGRAGNVYGVVPVSGSRDVSIVLMIIHQFVAYALYVTPVFFMWEKLVHTHQKPLWIRLPSRLPVCKHLSTPHPPPSAPPCCLSVSVCQHLPLLPVCECM